MPLPKDNLDNKSYEELITEALARLPIYSPEWTDHNVHDPGITFIELFAWLAEIQIYRLNRITDSSKKKFLKLLGIPYLQPAKPAKADVTFTQQVQNTIPVPAGTKVAAVDPVSGKHIVFETLDSLDAVDAKLAAVLSYSAEIDDFIDNTEANTNDNVYYYALGSEPKTDNALYLGFDKSLTGKLVLALYHYEDKPAAAVEHEESKADIFPPASLKWEYFAGGDWTDSGNWQQVPEVEDETNYLTGSGKISINLPAGIQQTNIYNNTCYWLRCKIGGAEDEMPPHYEIPPSIDVIRLNTVSALQSDTLAPYNFSGSGLPGFYLEVENIPILEKTLKVQISGTDWSRVEDFDASKPGDKHYVADLAGGRITFGDGINGKVPPVGENNISVSYSCGGGEWGNVPANSIIEVLGDFPEGLCVANKRAAHGGKEAQTLEQAIHGLRKDMKRCYRAVTSDDYEQLAVNTPGVKVARAKALPRYHKIHHREIPGIVTVVVIPYSPFLNTNPEPSPGFLETVYRHLDKYRLLTTELFVIPPEYIDVGVITKVVIKAKYMVSTLETAVMEALNSFLNPVLGGKDGCGWPFGRPVYISEIYELLEGVEGVDYVEEVTLKKMGTAQEGNVTIPEYGLVFSGEHEIEIKEEKDVQA